MGIAETYEQLRLHIKERMRARGKHLADLATEMEVSVSGLRKILSRDDISIKTLAQILEALGTNLEGFFAEKELRSTHEEFKLNEELDEYLANDFHGFVLFWLCAIERKPFKEVAKLLQCKPQELYKVLRKLEDFKVLKWKKGDNVVSELKPLLRLPLESHFRKAVEKCFFYIPFFKKPSETPNPGWKWRIWSLTPEQKQSFDNELEDLCLRYARLSSLTIRTLNHSNPSTTRFFWRAESFDVVKAAENGFARD